MPTEAEGGQAVDLLLAALKTGADIFDALSDIGPLHPKNDTFPGEVFIRLAADALEEGGIGRERPISGEDLVGRYLPECEFRGRDNAKIRYAMMAAAATAGGVQGDLLEEVAYWATDDFWSYAALAAVAWIRAVADQRAITLGALCDRLRAPRRYGPNSPLAAVLVIHATNKLRDRLKTAPPHRHETSTTALGDWYATALFWRPQVALFVNETTLLPVLVPLAPSATLVERFAPALAEVLAVQGATRDFIEAETGEMGDWRLAKTANRSVVGIMTEFTYLAEAYLANRGESNLRELSLRLSETPCGPLSKRHHSPDRELAALLSQRQTPWPT